MSRPVWARQCHCGRIDRRERWESAEAADDAGVYFSSWECPACGGTDFELVELGDDAEIEQSNRRDVGENG